MKVLLTGATGFLGSHLAKALLHRGDQVLAYCRESSDFKRVKSERNAIEWFDANRQLEGPFKKGGIDAVVHTATCYGKNGESRAELVRSNIVFPLELLKQASVNGTGAFLNTDTFFSRAAVGYSYLSDYIRTKRQLREWLQDFKSGVHIFNLQLEHVYGPGDDPSKFVTGIFERLLRNEESIALTSGVQERDFVYVDDVVQAYLKILDFRECSSKATVTLELGTGLATSVRSFIEEAKTALNSSSSLHFGGLPDRPHDIPRSFADIEDMKKMGWNPRVTVRDGIRKMADALKSG